MRRVIFIAFMIGICSCLMAKSIWQDKNLYSSDAGLDVGNIIIVSINDISDMKFNISLSNKSTSSVTSNPDMTITGFLPKISANKKITNDDNTQFSGKGKMSFALATRILNRVPGGMFAISGSRTYTFNGVTSIVTVTGIIDPIMVKGGAIDSRNVADFTLEIRGLKEGIVIQRDPLKEGESAASSLTEEEKQRIIVDYLQKMIGELTK